MDKAGHQRVVARVVLLEGSEERVAILLGVPSPLVARWVAGLTPVPTNVFVRCVDYLLDHPAGSIARVVASAANEDKHAPAPWPLDS